MLKKTLLVAGAATLFAGSASAALFDEPVLDTFLLPGSEFVTVEKVDGGDSGTTHDLFVNTTSLGDWTTAGIFLQLDSGSIFQNTLGGDNTVPNPAFFAVDSTLQFDSFVTANGLNASLAGAAGDVGGSSQRFTDTVLDVTWNNTATDDIGEAVHIGRLTFSADANGSGQLFFTAGGTGQLVEVLDIVVENGQIVPEPASLALLGLGGLAALTRRRTA